MYYYPEGHCLESGMNLLDIVSDAAVDVAEELLRLRPLESVEGAERQRDHAGEQWPNRLEGRLHLVHYLFGDSLRHRQVASFAMNWVLPTPLRPMMARIRPGTESSGRRSTSMVTPTSAPGMSPV